MFDSKRILSCIVVPGRKKRSYEGQTLEEYVLKRVRPDDDIVQLGRQFQASESSPPRLLQSSLKSTASIYQKQLNCNDRANLLSRLKNHLGELKDIVVRKVLLEKQNGKWYITLTLDFHKVNDPSILTESHVTFRTEVFTSFNADNIDTMFSATHNTLLQKISNYQSNGSGWVVDHFIDVSLGNYLHLRIFWWLIIRVIISIILFVIKLLWITCNIAFYRL